ncbi:hypothetical protein NM688_g648 [Phlebia brevispora]|uniref:Uncharacterized protein n=1 Tax=Phlebia brevispora TaxID=194682 RepID=A0ACC1TDF3_9APHY|nr:hypothetical protein NM688_g648 [Phlebia brevispora]
MHVPDIVRDSLLVRLLCVWLDGYFCTLKKGLASFSPQDIAHQPPRPVSEDATQANASSHSTRIAVSKPTDSTSKEPSVSVAEAEVRETDGEESTEPPQESILAQEYLHHPVPNDVPHDVEKAMLTIHETHHGAHNDPNIVDWYGPDDPEAPMNVGHLNSIYHTFAYKNIPQWSFFKRCLVTFDICILTFSIYIGAAIFAPGIPDMSQKFHISEVAASLGLTMFITGYGVGPMFLSPLSEIPQFGRAPVYMITLVIFICLQVPTALAKNIGTIIALRFLAGFIGSPPLATGGASLADMFTAEDRATVLGLWGVAAMSGPALGPVIGGFVAQAKGWTWTIWILLWLGGGSAVFLAFFMPETSSQAILYRRAVRLRRLTGNQQLRSQGEIDAAQMTMGDIAMLTLIRPFLLGFTEPIVAFWNVYIALVYGILYCFVSAFDVVFIGKHHWNLGQNGLSFLGIIIGVGSAWLCYLPWATRYLKPKFWKGVFKPEDRLPLAMVGAFILPASLFWFGWTSGGNIHWISPILASTLWAASAFFLFQAGLNYLADCYPRYVASVMAGNDFFRSMLGAAFPLFSTAFFKNLGVGQACNMARGSAHGAGTPTRPWTELFLYALGLKYLILKDFRLVYFSQVNRSSIRYRPSHTVVVTPPRLSI